MCLQEWTAMTPNNRLDNQIGLRLQPSLPDVLTSNYSEHMVNNWTEWLHLSNQAVKLLATKYESLLKRLILN